jgi:hypothetical protein
MPGGLCNRRAFLCFSMPTTTLTEYAAGVSGSSNLVIVAPIYGDGR